MSDASTDILDAVMQTIAERKRTLPADSYVATLLRGGIDKIGGKVIEEARELVEAARASDRSHVVHEAADLLFHTLVLIGWADVSLDEVRAELKRRHGTSGLAEKASRTGDRS